MIFKKKDNKCMLLSRDTILDVSGRLVGMHTKSLQSCLTLCDPMDCSSPGSSVHGILQTRILEWVPIPSSRGSS